MDALASLTPELGFYQTWISAHIYGSRKILVLKKNLEKSGLEAVFPRLYKLRIHIVDTPQKLSPFPKYLTSIYLSLGYLKKMFSLKKYIC